MWTEFSAEKVIGWGASRNDHNPCIFRIEDTDLDIEQHGDDFVVEGPRQAVVELREQLNAAFLVKKADIISMHPDDDKEGHFLHRHVYVDEDGWHEELESKYVDNILETSGMGNCNIAKTPGIKANDKVKEEDAVGQSEHSNFRSIAGLASYMCDRRGDINFPTKESLRKLARPTATDMIDLKRICRYLRGVPRCVLDFPWRGQLPEDLDVYVDSDWCGESDTRKSTSGGAACLDDIDMKHWCVSQATIALSSAEAEHNSAIKGTVEGLYRELAEAARGELESQDSFRQLRSHRALQPTWQRKADASFRSR